MAADGATLLVTAHHATDQAETVLMRLGHGSGLGGLGGMALLSEVEGVPVCRPLLGVAPRGLRRWRGTGGWCRLPIPPIRMSVQNGYGCARR